MMRICFAVFILFGSLSFASAMDRWAALSMLESGDNDHAVGPAGEVSRFQIRHELWSGGNPQDGQVALAAAQGILQPRLDGFQKSHKRAATDSEFFVLWNAPQQVDHPSVAVAARSQRFANLVQR